MGVLKHQEVQCDKVVLLTREQQTEVNIDDVIKKITNDLKQQNAKQMAA